MSDDFFGMFTAPVTNTPKAISYDCETCGLYKQCNSPKTGVTGKGKSGILIINEFASLSDDNNGSVMEGHVGNYLNRIIRNMDMDIDEDFYRINAVQCTPYQNSKMRRPLDREVECCRTQLHKVIGDLQPKVILTIGDMALRGLIGDQITGRIKKVKWEDFYNFPIPDQKLHSWVIATYSPFYFKDNRETVDFDRLVKNAVKMAVDYVEKPFPIYDVKKLDIEIIHDDKRAKEVICNYDHEFVSFDYETNCIKSQGDNKKVICTSLSDGKKTYVIENNANTNKYLKLLLNNDDIGKIVHNLTFEDNWTYSQVTGKAIDNWMWDTCLAAHCCHNQRSTGLKLWTYLCFGIIGYDSGVEEYIISSDDAQERYGANALNNIHQAPLDDIMYYCGVDTWSTANIYPIQYDILKSYGDDKLVGYKFYLDGLVALSEMHRNGVCFDSELASKVDAQITIDVNRTIGGLLADYPGWNGKLSGKGLETFVYKTLGLKSESGSLDKEAMESMNHPFTDGLLEIKQLTKIRDTFLAGFFKENTDGKVHAFFNLNRVKTFRSCVAAGTDVLMADTSQQPIEYVNIGDYVVTLDDCHERTTRKVLAKERTGYREIVRIEYESEDWSELDGFIEVTPCHKVRLQCGSYVRADQLVEGDKLASYRTWDEYSYNPDNPLITQEYSDFIVTDISPAGKAEVYDLEVDEFNNFCAGDIFVHNSSDSVNFQNISKKNKVAKKYIRKSIVPSPNCRIGEFDYRALEAFVGAEIYKDATFLEYTTNPKADLHKDVSLRIIGKSEAFWHDMDKAIAKNIRDVTKILNFASMFGGGTKTTAPKMWVKYTKETKAFFKKVGIRTFEDFEKRVQSAYNWLWNEAFKDYGRLRQETYDNYLKDGYIDLPTGFRCQAPIIFTEAVNIIVQGSASHMKLAACIEIRKELKKRKLKSKLIAEIHDAILLDIHKDEEVEIQHIVEECMTKRIYSYFPWFKMQLYIEGEITKLRENGGNWADMESFDMVMYYYYNGLEGSSTDARLSHMHEVVGKIAGEYTPEQELQKLEQLLLEKHSADVKRFIESEGKVELHLKS